MYSSNTFRPPSRRWSRTAWWLAVVSLAALATLVGCGGSGGGGDGGVGVAPAVTTGVVRGTVVPPAGVALSVRGEAVATGGAEVFIESRPDLTSRTDAAGNFAISGVPLGQPVRVIARLLAPGAAAVWLARSDAITPGVDGNGGAVALPLAAATNRLVIEVRSPENRVPFLAAAMVWGMPFADDLAGNFTSPLLPETASQALVTITAPGYRSVQQMVPFFAAATPPRMHVVLVPDTATSVPPLLTMDAATSTVGMSAPVSLHATVFDGDDADALRLTPTWSTTGGTIATGADPWSIVWHAPAQAGLATVSVAVVDRSGLSGQAALAFAVGGQQTVIPRIATFTPAAAAAGRTLVISGTGFGPAATATSAVTIAGLSATIVSWSDTQIRVVVPEFGQTGAVAVTTAAGMATGGTFTFVDYPIALAPTYGPPQTVVTLTGYGFDAAAGTGTVLFNGATASVLLWSERSITAQVPQFGSTGVVTVRVRGRERAAPNFTVTRVTSITPTRALRETEVVIEGNGFGSSQGESRLTFPASLTAEPTSWSDTRITANIPARANTGPMVLTIHGVPVPTPVVTLSYTNSFTLDSNFGEAVS